MFAEDTYVVSSSFSKIHQKANYNPENLAKPSLQRFSINLKSSNFCPKAIKS